MWTQVNRQEGIEHPITPFRRCRTESWARSQTGEEETEFSPATAKTREPVAWVEHQRRCTNQLNGLVKWLDQCAIAQRPIALRDAIGKHIRPGGSFSKPAWRKAVKVVQRYQQLADTRLGELEPQLPARQDGQRIQSNEIRPEHEKFRRLCNNLSGFYNLLKSGLRSYRDGEKNQPSVDIEQPRPKEFVPAPLPDKSAWKEIPEWKQVSIRPPAPRTGATNGVGKRGAAVQGTGKGEQPHNRASTSGSKTSGRRGEPVTRGPGKSMCRYLRPVYHQEFKRMVDLAERANCNAAKFIRLFVQQATPEEARQVYDRLARYRHDEDCDMAPACSHAINLAALCKVAKQNSASAALSSEDPVPSGSHSDHAERVLASTSDWCSAYVVDTPVPSTNSAADNTRRSTVAKSGGHNGARAADDKSVHKQGARKPTAAKSAGPADVARKPRASFDEAKPRAEKKTPVHRDQRSDGAIKGGRRRFGSNQQPKRQAEKTPRLRKTRVVESLAETDAPAATQRLTGRLGGQEGSVLPGDRRSEAGEESGGDLGPPSATRANSPRILQRQKRNRRSRSAKLDLARDNTRRLPTQPSEGVRRAGNSRRAETRPRDGVSSPSGRGSNNSVAKAGKANRGHVRISFHVSAKQEKALQQGNLVTVELQSNTARLGHFSIRKIREAENIGEGRRPANDSGKDTQIQSVPGSVHKGSGKEPLQPRGSRSPKARDTPKGDRKGDEPHREGPSVAQDLGSDGGTGSGILRSQPVGHARKQGAPAGDAPLVSKPATRQAVSVATPKAVGQQMQNQQGSEVQNRRRGHVWRHDDSTGKLCCSYCDTHNLPSYIKARCRSNRKRHLRRERRTAQTMADEKVYAKSPIDLSEKTGGIGAAVPQSRPNINGQPVRDGQPSSVVPISRRRRRSCSDIGKQVQCGLGENLADTLEVGRPHAESGRDSERVPSDSLLSTQALLRPDGVGDGPGPKESPSDLNGGIGSVPGETGDISEDSVECKSDNAQRGSNSRPTVCPDTQTVEGSANSGGEGKTSQGDRQPSDKVTSGDEGPADVRSNTGSADDDLGAVGSRPRNPASHGKVGSSRPRVPSAKACPVPEITQDLGDIELRNLDLGSLPPALYMARGDLLKNVDCGFIYHCVGVDATMGKGFAHQIAKTFPGVKRAVRKEPDPAVGIVVPVTYGPYTIMNAMTKPKSSVPAVYSFKTELEAVDTLYDTLIESCHYVKSNGGDVLFIPWLVGCGLDRLPSDQVEAAVDAAAHLSGVRIIAYNNSVGSQQRLKLSGDVEENPGPGLRSLVLSCARRLPQKVITLTAKVPAVKVAFEIEPARLKAVAIKLPLKVNIAPIFKSGYKPGQLLEACKEMQAKPSLAIKIADSGVRAATQGLSGVRKGVEALPKVAERGRSALNATKRHFKSGALKAVDRCIAGLNKLKAKLAHVPLVIAPLSAQFAEGLELEENMTPRQVALALRDARLVELVQMAHSRSNRLVELEMTIFTEECRLEWVDEPTEEDLDGFIALTMEKQLIERELRIVIDEIRSLRAPTVI